MRNQISQSRVVNETRVAMEVEPTLEVEIRKGQLVDAKLKEIQ
jgi:hypothetical protein